MATTRTERARRAAGLAAGALVLLALAGCGDGGTSTTAGPATTAVRTTAAPVRADRIELLRSGGVAAPPVPQRLVITEPAVLRALSTLLPAPLPPSTSVPPTGCADCRAYVVLVRAGGQVRRYAFSEDAVPPALRRITAALSARMNRDRS